MASDQPVGLLASMHVPSDFSAPPSEEMKHFITLNIPLPTALAAQQLFHVLRVDRELKPSETHVSYRIDSRTTPKVLDVCVHCRTVRQLRLSVNALLDNISLVIATMDAFTPPEQQQDKSTRGDVGGTHPTAMTAKAETIEADAPDEEYELSGTGRAG